MKCSLAAMILAAAVVAGCSDGAYEPQGPGRAPATQVAGQLAPVDDQGQPITGRPAPPPLPPPSAVEGQPGGGAPPPPPLPAANIEREAVHPGVTGRGQGLGSGLIMTPLKVYFSVPEKLVFNVLIPQAMNLYRAEHEHFPESHEEFMEKIIKANAINLPKLRSPDERYVYDPQKAAEQTQYDIDDPPLMVERPQQ
jgi:hypothetical protein